MPPSIPTPLQQRAESLNHNEIRGVNKASRKLMGGQPATSIVMEPCVRILYIIGRMVFYIIE